MRVSIQHHTNDTMVELSVTDCIMILNGEHIESEEENVVVYDEFTTPEEGPQRPIRNSAAKFTVVLIDPNK